MQVGSLFVFSFAGSPEFCSSSLPYVSSGENHATSFQEGVKQGFDRCLLNVIESGNFNFSKENCL